MMHRFQPPVAEIEELPPIDVVLLSHSHYDHLEQESIEKLMKTQSHFVVSLGMGVILQKWGIDAARITELDWWQSTERNGVKYTALPARHDSSRGLFDHNKALWSGFLIEHKRGQNEERFYFHGDSAQGKHFDEIASRVGKIDIAFIENGQYDERWPNNHLSLSKPHNSQPNYNQQDLCPFTGELIPLPCIRGMSLCLKAYQWQKHWE